MNWHKINRLLMPWLTIEVTNCCNYNCKMCTVGKKDPLKPQYLSLESYKKILENIEKNQFFTEDLRLFWVGEPSCNPDFPEIIKSTVDFSVKNPHIIPRIGFDTNASKLCSETIESLLYGQDRLPIHITISLDAVKSDTYAMIRKGGILEKTRENIFDLLGKRHAHNRIYPKIMLQFVIMEENVEEAKEFRDYWMAKFAENGINGKDFLNASWAEDDGINWRPLTEQEDSLGILQERANDLFSDTVKKLGLIDKVEKISISSQGGGGHLIG